MNKTIRNTIDSETPFIVISIKDYEIRIYWTANKGMYGHQAVTAIYKTGEGMLITDKTGGCGYSKECEATVNAFRAINIAPKEMIKTIKSHCHDTMTYRYKIGGNFYKVPNKDVRVINKRGK